MKVKSLSRARLSATPWTIYIAHQAPPLQYSCLEGPMDGGAQVEPGVIMAIQKFKRNLFLNLCVIATHSGRHTHSEGQCR